MPLYAAIRRSLVRKWLIFLGFGFSFEPEGRGFESLPARHFYLDRLRTRQVSEANRRVPPGAPFLPRPFADSTGERSERGEFAKHGGPRRRLQLPIREHVVEKCPKG